LDNTPFERLKALALPLFKDSDSAHDLGHAMRVLALAETISKEEGADMSVVRPAALIHDIGCAPKHLGKERESEDRTMAIAKDLLERSGYDEAHVKAILYIIEVHGYSRGIVPETLEGKVLQDADRLDAMGAMGIARTFLVSGSTNRPIHHIEDPWAEGRDLDDKAYGLDHFFCKLLKLKDGMHTATGRRMAEDRHATLERYIDSLRREMAG
jgi:uncharacterized protein